MKEEHNPSHKIDYDKFAPIIKADKSMNLPLAEHSHMALVFSRHRFYRHLVIELISAEKGKNGKLKNPFRFLDPMDRLWKAENQEEIKFLAGLSRFRNNYDDGRVAADFEALKAVMANPLHLDFYILDEKKSATVNASTLLHAKFSLLKPDLELEVDERGDTFAISGLLHLEGKSYALERITLHYRYFVKLDQQFYLIGNPYFLDLIDFFKQQQNNLVIEREAYEEFREKILSKLEEKVKINYAYLKPATEKQRVEQGFDLENEQLVYLSDSEDFVLITPVMKYGNLEIPVISQKQIQAKDKRGKPFAIERDTEKELQLISLIAKSHPYLTEQVSELAEQGHADCFYIHRKHFMEPAWFLEAFEAWRSKGIAILGFNQLRDNKFSAYKAEVAISVISGIDWFETAIKVQFNKQALSLKHLHKSIRNKNRFVLLDDGTLGVIPDEWLQKLEGYFGAGEIVGDVLRTPHINFVAVETLYEATQLDREATERLRLYRSIPIAIETASFEAIENVVPPQGLQVALRGYQQAGLNWLNFLDKFNFGACLADDMGLGKTVQVLAFLLSQREKVAKNTNLVVVPASLVFNWQQEIKKFAPSLKVLTIYGAERPKIVNDFDQYEIVLTSYGTLLADIQWLKDYFFNYVVLDESQAIKNPDSQRYKAVRLLKSRNKIAMTGTPIENNTFDIYGQLSFACPGLLGSREQFRRLYSVPIDQFKDKKRAAELQSRINPFVLRRTKAQVADELPDKTEMVIYCEMGKHQREIYEGCRTEIRDYIMGTAEDELTKSSMHVLQGITKLRQICNSPSILGEEKYYGNASAKMDVLLEQIESKAPFHKILVFSQFVSMLELVKTELEARQISFAYLTGQTKNREAVVDSFQQNEEVRVFLISLKAGGVGLNLTKAAYIYLIDPWWNPAVENQAIDRAYRIGQHQNVMAVRLICPDTVEEKIMLMQAHKKDLVSSLIKTEKSVLKSLTKKDLLDLL